MNQPQDWVRSEILPWSSPIEEIGDFARIYHVGVELVPERSTTYAVRITGLRHVVRECIRQQWCSNTELGSVEQEDEIDTYLGDPLATHRFNTGCNVGRGSSWKDIELLNEELFNWQHHWNRVGGDRVINENSDRAIDFLSTAGITPERAEDERIQRAQTYLMLAFAYAGELMELEVTAPTPPREGVPQLGDASVDEILAELHRRSDGWGDRSWSLDDCINWKTNNLGDCGGRVEQVGNRLLCENCRNTKS